MLNSHTVTLDFEEKSHLGCPGLYAQVIARIDFVIQVFKFQTYVVSHNHAEKYHFCSSLFLVMKIPLFTLLSLIAVDKFCQTLTLLTFQPRAFSRELCHLDGL